MKGLLANHRRGRHTQRTNQFLVDVEGCDTKAMASGFIGRRVVWRSPSGKEIFGRITQVHGTRGTLRARFTRGLPGDALGGMIDILE